MKNHLVIVIRLIQQLMRGWFNLETSEPPQHDYLFRVAEYLSESVRIRALQPRTIGDEGDEGNGVEEKVDTLVVSENMSS